MDDMYNYTLNDIIFSFFGAHMTCQYLAQLFLYILLLLHLNEKYVATFPYVYPCFQQTCNGKKFIGNLKDNKGTSQECGSNLHCRSLCARVIPPSFNGAKNVR